MLPFFSPNSICLKGRLCFWNVYGLNENQIRVKINRAENVVKSVIFFISRFERLSLEFEL